MKIGENINNFVVENRIPKGRLAKKSGMTENALSLSLNGKRKLNAEEYLNICDALCVSYDFCIKRHHENR